MPTIFVPKETVEGETRVAAVPETVKKLVKAGFSITVEAGAGAGAHISDAEYQEAGATVGPDAASMYGAADVVLKLHPPTQEEAGKIKENALLVSFLFPFNNLDLVEKLRAGKVTAFAMDQVPVSPGPRVMTHSPPRPTSRGTRRSCWARTRWVSSFRFS